jgi:peptidyl-prolyl cis-trans isomerase SurA
MMRVRVYIVPLIVLALFLAALPSGAEEVNRVVAVVGEDVITSLDLDKVIKTMEAQLGRIENPAEAVARQKQMRKVALERLIEDRIFQQEVTRQNIRVTQKEIDRYIERIKSRNQISEKQFAAHLSRRGLTPDEYKAELKKDILKQKLIQRSVKQQVVISDDQVQEYYRKHLNEYGKLDEVRLRAIFLTVPDDAGMDAREVVHKQAEKLREEAVEKNNMAELAKEHSQGPGASKGGLLEPVSSKDMIPAMRQALGQMKAGDISQVLNIPGGFVFFELLAKGGDNVLAFNEVKEQIREKLESEALEKKFQTWMDDLRKKTFVEIVGN